MPAGYLLVAQAGNSRRRLPLGVPFRTDLGPFWELTFPEQPGTGAVPGAGRRGVFPGGE